MAKRGERRPWRIRFEWDNGIKGCKTFAHSEDARYFVEEIRGTAVRRDIGLAIRLEKDGESYELAGRGQG